MDGRTRKRHPQERVRCFRPHMYSDHMIKCLVRPVCACGGRYGIGDAVICYAASDRRCRELIWLVVFAVMSVLELTCVRRKLLEMIRAYVRFYVSLGLMCVLR